MCVGLFMDLFTQRHTRVRVQIIFNVKIILISLYMPIYISIDNIHMHLPAFACIAYA